DINEGDLDWDVSATLGAGETLTLTFDALVTSTIIQGNSYTNTMSASGEEGNGSPIPADNSDLVEDDTDADDSSSVTHLTAEPGLSVNKEIVDILRNGSSIGTTGPVEPGDVIEYRFTVENVGQGTAYEVNFTDQLPTGLEYDTDAGSGTYQVDDPSTGPTNLGISDGATGTIDPNLSATIDGGGTLTARFYALVTSDVSQAENAVNTATAYGRDGAGNPIPPENPDVGDTSDLDPDDPDADDTGTEEINVAEPGLSVDKKLTDVIRDGSSIWPTSTALPGDILVYEFTIKNVGQGTAYEVNFTDQLPTGLEYDTDAGSGTYQVDDPSTGPTNLGISDGATGTIDPNLSAVVNGGGTLTANFYALVAEEAVPGTQLVNTAEATGEDGAGNEIPDENTDVGDISDLDPDDPDADDTGTEAIKVGAPALSVNKEIIDIIRQGERIGPSGPVEPGDIIEYQFIIENVGNATAYNVNFEDELASSVYYDNSFATGIYTVDDPAEGPSDLGITTGATGTISASIGVRINPAGVLTATYYARVTSELTQGESLFNLASATGEDDTGSSIPPEYPDIGDTSDLDPDDPDPDDTGTETIDAAEPALVTDKAITGIQRKGSSIGTTGPVEPGDVITYQAKVENVGEGIAYDVDLKDILPTGFEYLSGTTDASWPESSYSSDPSDNTGTISWDTSATLEGGQTLTLSYEVDVNSDIIQANTYTNTIAATGEDGNGEPIPPDNSEDVEEDTDEDDESSTSLEAAEPALITEKSVEEVTRNGESVTGPVEPGDKTTYVLSVRNIGGGVAYNVDITDSLPERFQYVDGSTEALWPGGSMYEDPDIESQSLLKWDISATLKAGESLSLSFTARIEPLSDSDYLFVNRMHATGEDGSGTRIPENNRDDVTADNDLNDSSEVTIIRTGPAGEAAADYLATREEPERICEKAHSLTDGVWFRTDEAMFASYEFANLDESMTVSDLHSNTLLPTWNRTFLEDASEYSRLNLTQVNRHSKLGVSLLHAPRVENRAREDNVDLEAALLETLKNHAEAAGYDPDKIEREERWTFLEYAGGDPRFRLRITDQPHIGNWSATDDRIIPSSIGMSLLKQAQAIEKNYDATYSSNRYLSAVLTEIALNKLTILERRLGLDKASMGGRYFPHEFAVSRSSDNGDLTYQVIDPGSYLFDLNSLLLGLTEFSNVLRPGALSKLGFAESNLESYRSTTINLLEDVIRVIRANHFRNGEVFLGEVAVEGQLNPADTVNLGLLVDGLHRALKVEALEDKEEIRELYQIAIERLMDRRIPDGSFANNLKDETTGSGSQKFVTQMAAMRALLSAYERSEKPTYLESAKDIFDLLKENYWNEDLKLFASSRKGPSLTYCYTPFDIGLSMSAFRKLAGKSGSELRGEISQLAGEFFDSVVNEAALQLSNAMIVEGSGRSGDCEIYHGQGRDQIGPLNVYDSRNGIAPVLQRRICLNREEVDKRCPGLRSDIQPWFQTDISMYAAYEIHQQLGRLEDYSDSNLTNLIFHSGMGIPISDLYLGDRFKDRLEEFTQISGLNKVPDITPIALEYYRGSPQLGDLEDNAWSEETFQKGLFGSAIGMTLLREVQEAEQLLTDSVEGEIAETPEKSLNALLLLESIKQKVSYIGEIHGKARELVGQAYVPDKVTVSRENNGIEYRIDDSSSSLFDRISILWGLTKTVGLLERKKISDLFEDEDLFSDLSIQEIKDLVDNEFSFLVRNHLNEDLDILDDQWTPDRRSEEEQLTISTENIGLLVPCLKEFNRVMGDDPGFTQRVRNLILDETNFLLSSLRSEEGGFRNSYKEPASQEESLNRSLGSQLAAIRALVESYELFEDESFLDTAQSTFEYLVDEYWQRQLDSCSSLELFDDEFGSTNPCYTPFEVGLAAGALEGLANNSTPAKAERIRNRLESFSRHILDRANMQLPRNLWNYRSEEPVKSLYSRVFAQRVCLEEDL
ncbi:DUF11 domain-containing protein, partial [Candidatus Bipolaricaulota bacterium]|nr:DUF11 domain-containing protein [Candidatus Bipolaricaulota bacterium]